MTESVRPSAALRIVRPYATEEALLESELETIGRTGVILVGAEARPAGVVLRFDVALADGTVLLRGEGRVLGFKERGFHGEPALAVRFTRLDARSKAVVDRAVARREENARREAGDASEEKERPIPAPAETAPLATTESPTATTETAPLAPSIPDAPPDGERDARLQRLRERAAALSTERVDALLRSSPRRNAG